MGKFIVFEGVDGSGKSTALDNVKIELENQGYSVIAISGSGIVSGKHSITGRMIREKLDTKEVSSSLEIALLYISNMVSMSLGIKGHSKSINELLEEYDYVLCDRWFYSTIVYGVKDDTEDGLFVGDTLYNLLSYSKIPKPDMVIVLHAPLPVIFNRVGLRDEIEDYYSSKDKLSGYHTKYLGLKIHVLSSCPKLVDLIDFDKIKHIDSYREHHLITSDILEYI